MLTIIICFYSLVIIETKNVVSILMKLFQRNKSEVLNGHEEIPKGNNCRKRPYITREDEHIVGSKYHFVEIFRLNGLKNKDNSCQSLVDDSSGRTYQVLNIHNISAVSSCHSSSTISKDKKALKSIQRKQTRNMRKQSCPVRLEIKRGGTVGGI